MDRAELIDKRPRDHIAEPNGPITTSEAKVRMVFTYRAALPVVTASGGYGVMNEEPGGITIQLKDLS